MHAGTLDPFAECVLVVSVGREATKQLRFVLEENKEYIGEIKLGMVNETDDEEGVKTLTNKVQDTKNKLQINSKKQDVDFIWPILEKIEKVIQENFIGDIVQITPTYSAVKIGGERAYKKARRGEEFTRPPRIVTVKEVEVLDYSLKKFSEIKQKNNAIIPAGEYPVLRIKMIVGSGTYVRSIAREIGEKLTTGGYLTSLVRTRVANYNIKDSLELSEIK